MRATKKTAKKPVKKSGMRARGKSKADAINHTAITNALIANNIVPGGPVAGKKPRSSLTAAVYGVDNSPKGFFNNNDDKLTALKAPGVYREDGGSRTTILLYVGRTRCQHIPMDATGLVIIKTPLRAFREAWVRTPYDVATAALKYLKTSGEFFIDAHPRVKAALDLIAAGGDEAAVKRAIDQALPDDSPHTNGGLAGDLRVAAKANGKAKRGANLPKGRGIGAWVCEQLCAKVDDAKILKEVVKKFPGAKTNASHLNWYRNKLKRDGAL